MRNELSVTPVFQGEEKRERERKIYKKELFLASFSQIKKCRTETGKKYFCW
jgi:hypothetical protein